MGAESIARFVNNMRKGVTLVTHFSGMDCPAHAAREIECAFHCMNLLEGEEAAGFKVYSACEQDKRALKCLHALRDSADWQKYASDHVFKRMEDLVKPEALQKIRGIFDKHARERKADAAPVKTEAGWALVREILQVLLLEDGLQSKASCEVHGGQCNIFAPMDANDGMTLEVAGTPCVDLSKRGKRQQIFGDSCLPFCVWIAQLIKSKQPLALHECTVDFPDWLLELPLQHFAARTWRIMTFRLCPSNFGQPCRRPRRYTVVWDSSVVTFAGSYSDFVQTFFEMSELRGNIWFQNGGDLDQTVCASRLEAFQMYRDAWLSQLQHGKSSVTSQDICDLNQKPPHGKLDMFVPTLVTHNSMYCIGKAKLLTAAECLMVQGIPEDSPVFQLAGSGALSSNAVRHLAGNGMSAVCVGSMLMYIISHTSKVAPKPAFARQSQCSRLFG